MPKTKNLRYSFFSDRCVTKRIFKRQSTKNGHYSFPQKSHSEKFKNFSLKREFDLYKHTDTAKGVLCPSLMARTRVVEIVQGGDMLFCLSENGVGGALDYVSGQLLCYINTSPQEVIRSIFYNKMNNSLVTVSVFRDDNFCALHCRSTPLEYIRRKKPEEGFEIFTSEFLKHPGFVEFDEVNGTVLTLCSRSKVYKVWELRNYEFIFKVSDDKNQIDEIKITPGLMLIVYKIKKHHLPLQLLCINTGKVIKEFYHMLHKNKTLCLVEQFNEALLIKQRGESLQIVNVITHDVVEVPNHLFPTPTACIFLFESNLFISLLDRTAQVWNFRGELVTKFEDHLLWNKSDSSSIVAFNKRQDVFMSLCKNSSFHLGSINISSIETGECIAKITSSEQYERVLDRNRTTEVFPSDNSKRALQEVSCLCYNETSNEIYTGGSSGAIYVWSN